MSDLLQPILVMMSYRGGARLARCLDSIERSQGHFNRILLSVTASEDSEDMDQCRAFKQDRVPKAEVICTGMELPTMQHQAFWVTYLRSTNASPHDWIYWLAYDDEVRAPGINAITDQSGNWPLKRGTAYFGPWAMRHEQAHDLWSGDPQALLESWTSFPLDGPTRLPVMTWITDQLRQPTYLQMSGSVCQLGNFMELRDSKPTKTGPMRIEMATAACRTNSHVEEFAEPVTIIYARPNSDRANYGPEARKEDFHLLQHLGKYVSAHPTSLIKAFIGLTSQIVMHAHLWLSRQPLPREEWRVRGWVDA